MPEPRAFLHTSTGSSAGEGRAIPTRASTPLTGRRLTFPARSCSARLLGHRHSLWRVLDTHSFRDLHRMDGPPGQWNLDGSGPVAARNGQTGALAPCQASASEADRASHVLGRREEKKKKTKKKLLLEPQKRSAYNRSSPFASCLAWQGFAYPQLLSFCAISASLIVVCAAFLHQPLLVLQPRCSRATNKQPQ